MLQTSGWLVSHREESLHVDVLSIEHKSPEHQVTTLSWSVPTFCNRQKLQADLSPRVLVFVLSARSHFVGNKILPSLT